MATVSINAGLFDQVATSARGHVLEPMNVPVLSIVTGRGETLDIAFHYDDPEATWSAIDAIIDAAVDLKRAIAKRTAVQLLNERTDQAG